MTVDELKARWNLICRKMGNGSWNGTEADALAEIANIKAKIEELTK